MFKSIVLATVATATLASTVAAGTDSQRFPAVSQLDSFKDKMTVTATVEADEIWVYNNATQSGVEGREDYTLELRVQQKEWGVASFEDWDLIGLKFNGNKIKFGSRGKYLSEDNLAFSTHAEGLAEIAAEAYHIGRHLGGSCNNTNTEVNKDNNFVTVTMGDYTIGSSVGQSATITNIPDNTKGYKKLINAIASNICELGAKRANR